MGFPRQNSIGSSTGMVGVSTGMVMSTGHTGGGGGSGGGGGGGGSGTSTGQHEAVLKEERAKQHRSRRAEELRNIYQEDIHYFVQHGSSLLKKLHKTRPASQNSEQVLKLVQYVKEGHNALLYINRCHDTGHVPSAVVVAVVVAEVACLLSNLLVSTPPIRMLSAPASPTLPSVRLGAPRVV
ncbi:unnamed protein product [Ectocarpus sp. 6 AP-2014]